MQYYFHIIFSIKTTFEPDKLALSKKDILDFCDRVIDKWSQNPSKNTNNILEMSAVKTSIVWTDDQSPKAIWSEIISWTFDLLYENALVQGGHGANLSDVMKKIKNKKQLAKKCSMSAGTIRKAKKMVDSGNVKKIDDDLYQIKSSSDPNKSYFVTSDTCECLGFKNFYKFHHGKGLKANCSHLEALRIVKQKE